MALLSSSLHKYGLLCGLWFLVSWMEFVSSAASATLLFAAWLVLGGHETLYLMYHTLGRDLRGARMMLGLTFLVKYSQFRNLSVPRMFTATAKRLPHKPMLLFEGETWTFKDMEEHSNRVANFFHSRGLVKGDAVGLFMTNRPEFVAFVLGLAKIGVVPALINYNLRQEALLHSLEAGKCKAVIFGAELKQAVKDIKHGLDSDCGLYCSGERTLPPNSPPPPSNFEPLDLDSVLPSASSDPVSESVSGAVGFNDVLMFIYTSGTTGMPKAAVIKHSRYILAGGGCQIVIGCNEDDVIYSPLPLYHSVAGMISLAGTMRYGMTMVMRRKFSASSYWADCAKYGVTAGQYIGEVCRYLLNTPECEDEKRHKVRLMFGNGLRPQIWREFVQRFGIKRIAEFYGSTEGNSQTINVENREGAVGFVSLLFPGIIPLGLIKVEEETRKELRDHRGLCVPCKPGEPGEFVGKIVKKSPIRSFEGYADKSQTKTKILTDCFRRGDSYFRSGDVLVMDRFGWLYFVDRTGDTFRWRGENVSSTEVEATVSNLIELRDAVVYGVEIPGTEGRAGMAAIHDPEGEVDLARLAMALKEKLPSFARPMFVRLVKQLDMTGTFKLKKFNLQKEGYDPSLISDRLFFLHPKTGNYEALNNELFRSIVTGSIRL